MSGCSTSSASAYENCGAPAQGLQSYGAIGDGTLASWIAAAVAQSRPPSAPSSYAAVCEANIRARGLIYFKSSPGDCGLPGQAGFGAPQITGLSGSAASGVVGGLGAAGIIGGAATLGITAAISVAVAGIESIFAHHAQAVANEQATICQVANYINPLITAIDNAVKSGQISPGQGMTYLNQAIASATNGLATIKNTCNAACVYQAILQAHIYFAKNYYQYIAPAITIAPAAPAAPPANYGTPPGGVTLSGNNPAPPQPVRSLAQNTYAPAIQPSAPPLAPPVRVNRFSFAPTPSDNLNLGYNQPTGQSAQVIDQPPKGIDWQMVAAVIAIITLLFVVSRG